MQRPSAKLMREWDAKLRASGFEDIEYRGHDGAPLDMLKHACRIDEDRHPHQLEPTQEYFSRCAEYLHRGGLQGQERRVWSHHVDGASMRDIARVEGLPLKRVWTIVNALEARMGSWWPEHADEREEEQRAPRGRPRLEDRSAVRETKVGAHVTREELAVLAQAAELAGFRSVSAWLRAVAIENARDVAARNYPDRKKNAA